MYIIFYWQGKKLAGYFSGLMALSHLSFGFLGTEFFLLVHLNPSFVSPHSGPGAPSASDPFNKKAMIDGKLLLTKVSTHHPSWQ